MQYSHNGLDNYFWRGANPRLANGVTIDLDGHGSHVRHDHGRRRRK
jgi:hypothetical protein